MNSIENKTQSAVRKDEIASPKWRLTSQLMNIREKEEAEEVGLQIIRKGRVYRR
jgi:hypothetical protein